MIFFAALFAVLGRDTIKSSLVGLSVSYALQITQTFNFLVRMTAEVETNIVAIERVEEYSNVETEAAWDLGKVVSITNDVLFCYLQHYELIFFCRIQNGLMKVKLNSKISKYAIARDWILSSKEFHLLFKDVKKLELLVAPVLANQV